MATSDTAHARALYRSCAHRIAEAAVGDAGALERAVGPCPGWSARDLLGHLVGIARDWADGRLDGYASDAWTAAQVASVAGLGVRDLVDEWLRLLDALDGAADSPVLGSPWRWLAGDALCHEADLAETLGWPAPPPDAVAHGVDSVVPRWRAVLDEAGAPPLELRPTGQRPRPVGRRLAPGEEGVAWVGVEPYELWRALYGRRPRSDVEQWAWSTDPAPWLDPGLPYPFTFPSPA